MLESDGLLTVQCWYCGKAHPFWQHPGHVEGDIPPRLAAWRLKNPVGAPVTQPRTPIHEPPAAKLAAAKTAPAVHAPAVHKPAAVHTAVHKAVAVHKPDGDVEARKAYRREWMRAKRAALKT